MDVINHLIVDDTNVSHLKNHPSPNKMNIHNNDYSDSVIMVTGGAGFIGANFVNDWLALNETGIMVNLDKLTYAGNLENLAVLRNNRTCF